MSIELIVASVAITCALVLYTFGVFGERRSGTLSAAPCAAVLGGLVCDTTGTMDHVEHRAAIVRRRIRDPRGHRSACYRADARACRLGHGHVRASYERGMHRFHTFSTFVWLAWLVPYIIGMLVGIPMIHLQAVCAIGTSVVVVAVLAFVLFRGGQGSCAYRRATRRWLSESRAACALAIKSGIAIGRSRICVFEDASVRRAGWTVAR